MAPLPGLPTLLLGRAPVRTTSCPLSPTLSLLLNTPVPIKLKFMQVPDYIMLAIQAADQAAALEEEEEAAETATAHARALAAAAAAGAGAAGSASGRYATPPRASGVSATAAGSGQATPAKGSPLKQGPSGGVGAGGKGFGAKPKRISEAASAWSGTDEGPLDDERGPGGGLLLSPGAASGPTSPQPWLRTPTGATTFGATGTAALDAAGEDDAAGSGASARAGGGAGAGPTGAAGGAFLLGKARPAQPKEETQDDRTFWVRDTVWDPSGITNPLVAEAMTEAVKGALPAPLAPALLRVKLPAPVGGLIPPKLKDMPAGGGVASGPGATAAGAGAGAGAATATAGGARAVGASPGAAAGARPVSAAGAAGARPVSGRARAGVAAAVAAARAAAVAGSVAEVQEERLGLVVPGIDEAAIAAKAEAMAEALRERAKAEARGASRGFSKRPLSGTMKGSRSQSPSMPLGKLEAAGMSVIARDAAPAAAAAAANGELAPLPGLPQQVAAEGQHAHHAGEAAAVGTNSTPSAHSSGQHQRVSASGPAVAEGQPPRASHSGTAAAVGTAEGQVSHPAQAGPADASQGQPHQQQQQVGPHGESKAISRSSTVEAAAVAAVLAVEAEHAAEVRRRTLDGHASTAVTATSATTAAGDGAAAAAAAAAPGALGAFGTQSAAETAAALARAGPAAAGAGAGAGAAGVPSGFYPSQGSVGTVGGSSGMVPQLGSVGFPQRMGTSSSLISHSTFRSPQGSPSVGSRGAGPLVHSGPMTASELSLANMPQYSATLLLRNRLRQKAARLAGATAASQQRAQGRVAGGSGTASMGGTVGGGGASGEEGPAGGYGLWEEGSSATLSQMQAGGSPAQRAAAAVALGGVEVDGQTLLAKDLAYVTLEMPPPIKTTPDVEFTSKEGARGGASLGSGTSTGPALMTGLGSHPLPPPPVLQNPHMQAMMAAVSGPEGQAAVGAGGAQQQGQQGQGRYVPTFLRSKRAPLMPKQERGTKAEAGEQWVVPHYNSQQGFEYGLYDEDAELTYFD